MSGAKQNLAEELAQPDLPSLRTPQRQSVLELLAARGPVPPGFQVGEEKVGGQSFVTVAYNGHKLLALPSPDGWRFVIAFFDVARKMAREHRIGIAAEMLCMAPAELAAALEGGSHGDEEELAAYQAKLQSRARFPAL